MLDDRRVPGAKATLNHLVVAPSGVWVVEAKDYDGRVERRDVGGWFKVDERLYVGGKDRSHLVDGLDRHVIGVENLLAQAGLTSVPVHAALVLRQFGMGLVRQVVFDERRVGHVAGAADRTGARVEGDSGFGIRHPGPSRSGPPGFVSPTPLRGNTPWVYSGGCGKWVGNGVGPLQ